MFVLVTPGIAFITQLAMKLIKRFRVTVGPFSYRSQMTSKCGKNKNVILEVWSVISYCTDPRRWSRRLCVCPPTDDEMRVGSSLSYKFQYCYNFLVPRTDTSPCAIVYRSVYLNAFRRPIYTINSAGKTK